MSRPKIKRKLRAALGLVQFDPEVGRALKEELQAVRSCRVGRLRIINRLARASVIDIPAIGPRQTIYEETFRLVTRQTRRRP